MKKHKILYKQIPYQVKEVKEDERKILAVVSKEVMDSDGDLIKIDGMSFDRYIKIGAPLMWSHKHSDPPIGKATMLEKVGDEIIAEFEYAKPEEYGFADTIYKLTKGGYINSYSIGFKPDWASVKDIDKGRYLIGKSELLEISAVSIPANAEANVITRDLLSKALEDKVIDEVEMNELEIYLKMLDIDEDNDDDEFDQLIKDITDQKVVEKLEQNTKHICKDCNSELICPICNQTHKQDNDFVWVLSELDKPSPTKEDLANDILKSLEK
jgi:HK97 family phage prohead protease